MMISDLPHHLLEEILSRVPAMTLRRLRPTCKQWNDLLKDQIFTEKHHRKAPKQPLLLMLKEFRVCPVSVQIDLTVAAPSIEFKDALDLKGSDSQQETIIEVFHCEGLLLCVTKYNKVVVWNPLLGETKWIQASTTLHYKKNSIFALGYKNNDKSCREYKILRFCRSYNREDQIVEFEIYEFSSDSWRYLDGISLDFYIRQSPSVSLQGNTYWVATHGKDNSIFLLSFDFTRERFRFLSPPPVPWTMILSLVREEQISVLYMNMVPLKMELWVTNNFGTEDDLLWSKCFTVDLLLVEGRFPNFQAFILDEEKKVVVCPGLGGWCTRNVVHIIGEDDEYHTEIPYVNSTQKLWRPRIFNYVPSLVQIQQCRHKRQE